MVLSQAMPVHSATIRDVCSCQTPGAPRIRLAIIDHVTSNTALVLPVQRLTEVFHRAGAAVLVDGAHGIGMLDLNITALGADYYVR